MKEENRAIIKALNMYGRVPEMWELLQKIERLNKKIEQYENPEDMTLMFMWCDEKAKDEIKRLNNIIKEVREYIEEWQRFPHTNGSTHKELKNLIGILDKVD